MVGNESNLRRADLNSLDLRNRGMSELTMTCVASSNASSKMLRVGASRLAKITRFTLMSTCIACRSVAFTITLAHIHTTQPIVSEKILQEIWIDSSLELLTKNQLLPCLDT